MRRILLRATAILVIIILGAFLYDIGRMHTLILENREVALSDRSYEELQSIKIEVDGLSGELYPGDRILREVTGRRHKIKVEWVAKDGSSGVIERHFSTPHSETTYILKLPLLLFGQEEWLEVFRQQE